MAEEIEKEEKYTLKELQDKLTEKEKIFCHEYIIDWNGARAARSSGYSINSDRQIAADNLSKHYIKQYIDFIKHNLEIEAGISKLKNLKELAKIAYNSIEYIKDDWIELKDWHQIKKDNPFALAAVESIDHKTETRFEYNTKTEKNDKEVIVKYVKVKAFGKIQAIQEINKMQGYNAPDKIDHSGLISIEQITGMQINK